MAVDTATSSIFKLDKHVQDILAHEEAQFVISYIALALQENDCSHLELWMDEADSVGVESMLSGPPILEPIRQKLVEMLEAENVADMSHDCPGGDPGHINKLLAQAREQMSSGTERRNDTREDIDWMEESGSTVSTGSWRSQDAEPV